MPSKRSKYKHISWREGRTSGWIVQWQGRTLGGFHDTEEAAADTLRRARGLKRKNQLDLMPAPSKAPRQGSAFIGVCYHKGLQRFVVHDANTGGTYATAQEAASARAEALELPGPEKKTIPAKELIKRISLMRAVYMPVRGNMSLFADLESAVQHVVQSKAMFAAEPTYEMMCIQLKYDPWRNALLSAWNMRGSTEYAWNAVQSSSLSSTMSFHDDELHARASNLHSVLVQAVRNMANTDTEAWSRNCSRVVGRHSAPERVLQHLGILEEGPWAVQRSVSTLALSKEQVDASVQKLKKVIWAWTRITKVISNAPRTCREWYTLQKAMEKELLALKVDIPRLPRTKDSYVRAWTFRTLLIMRMRSQGISQLTADNDITPFKFCRLCPDQNDYMYKLYYALRPKSIEEFLSKCGFAGCPPELLSCFACFAGDSAWEGLGQSQYDVKSWTQVLHNYRKKHGLTAIPAVIISEM